MSAYRTIREHAAARQAAWLAEHGQHEWERHDLVAEALEEAVDGWAYVDQYLDREEWREDEWRKIMDARYHFNVAWRQLRDVQAIGEAK